MMCNREWVAFVGDLGCLSVVDSAYAGGSFGSFKKLLQPFQSAKTPGPYADYVPYVSNRDYSGVHVTLGH